MAEITFAGLTFRGGKIVGILVALSTLGGGLWAGFEFYKDYLDMKEKIQTYTAPDLSHYDTQIEVLRSEISTVLSCCLSSSGVAIILHLLMDWLRSFVSYPLILAL